MTFDANRSEPIVEAGFIAQRPMPGAPKWSPWLTPEVAKLRELYPLGGAEAVHAAMPHRTVSSIHGKAQNLKVKCLKASTQGQRFARKYPQSDHIDADIRHGYTVATRKGDYKRIAEKVGRPDWWVHKRAAQLGLTRNNRTRLDAWSIPELELLERWATCTLTVIRRKFSDAGFKRTETAIALKLKRSGIDRDDPDRWNPPSLAVLLGVNAKTVCDWIERRGLPAVDEGAGQQARYWVTRKQLRNWIKSHPRYIDLRKVDQVWFMDLVFGGSVT